MDTLTHEETNVHCDTYHHSTVENQGLQKIFSPRVVYKYLLYFTVAEWKIDAQNPNWKCPKYKLFSHDIQPIFLCRHLCWLSVL